MLTKINSKRVYNYLKNNNFDIQNVNPKIKDLLFDPKILKEVNSNLKINDKILYVKDIFLLEVCLLNSVFKDNNGNNKISYNFIKRQFGIKVYDQNFDIKKQQLFLKNNPNFSGKYKVYKIPNMFVESCCDSENHFNLNMKTNTFFVIKQISLQSLLKSKIDFITIEQLENLQSNIEFSDKIAKLKEDRKKEL